MNKTICSTVLGVALGLSVTITASAQQAAGGGVPAASSPTSGSSPIGNDQMGIRQYSLGPGDLLDLRVFNETQFDGTLEVNSEGYIFVPFIENPIEARCRSVQDVRKNIVVELSRLIRRPQVSLLIKERRSRTPAVVYGAVRMPQQFQMYRRVRLLELLGYTGGITEQANGSVQVFHTEPVLCPEPGDPVEAAPVASAAGDAPQITFDIYSINDLKMGKSEANPLIRPGDVVRVDEAAPVYVTGAVMQPQGIFLRDQMTLTRAVAMVGGLRKEAKGAPIKIYRQKPGSKQTEMIKVSYSDIRKEKAEDVLLQPYDVIEVGESSAFSIARLPETLIGIATTAGSGFANNLPVRVLY